MIVNRVSVNQRVIGSGAKPGESAPASGLLDVSLADSLLDVRASQRLRYRVFAEEMGAELETSEAGMDMDELDSFCRHLIVRDHATGEVVASTRLLNSHDAEIAGGFYSQKEFDLSGLLDRAGEVLEIGRTCVHPDYRSGSAISLLWSGLARFMELRRYQYLIGCASIPGNDGGTNAQLVFNALKEKYLVEDALRVVPRRELPAQAVNSTVVRVLPPLLKAYIRLGARIGGAPCWDPSFHCADLLVVLPTAAVARRYARHYMDRCA